MSVIPPGLIGYPCSDNGRTSDFTPSIVAMRKPAGTMLKKATGLGVANPLNEIGRAFMAHPELKWLLLTNDDNLCPPDTINRLWADNQKVGPAMITGLYFGRLMPFEPVLFDYKMVPPPDVLAGAPAAKRSDRWYHRRLMRIYDNGLEEIIACGDGCLFIPREIMEAIDDPWWEYGETLSDACDHDMVFCRKVIQAEYRIYVDTEVRVGHVTQVVVRPHRKPHGVWVVNLEQGDEGRVLEAPCPVDK